MENNNRDKISKKYFKYLKHQSTISTYFILFFLGAYVFKVSKYTAAISRLAIPFLISSAITLTLMAGLSFDDNQITFIERRRSIFRIGFLTSAILFIFGLVYTLVFFFMRH